MRWREVKQRREMNPHRSRNDLIPKPDVDLHRHTHLSDEGHEADADALILCVHSNHFGVQSLRIKLDTIIGTVLGANFFDDRAEAFLRRGYPSHQINIHGRAGNLGLPYAKHHRSLEKELVRVRRLTQSEQEALDGIVLQ